MYFAEMKLVWIIVLKKQLDKGTRVGFHKIIVFRETAIELRKTSILLWNPPYIL